MMPPMINNLLFIVAVIAITAASSGAKYYFTMASEESVVAANGGKSGSMMASEFHYPSSQTKPTTSEWKTFRYPPRTLQESEWIRNRTKPHHHDVAAPTATSSLMKSTKPTIEDIKRWDFDPLQYEEEELLTNVFPLILQYYGFDKKYNIPLDVLDAFSKEIRKWHHKNIYHNWFHIVSVIHMTFMFLEDAGASQYLQDKYIFAVLFSAYVHDVDHPGHTNSFEVNIHSETEPREFATRGSFIENHSLDVTYEKILSKKELDILQGFEEEERIAMKNLITETVLLTDVERYHKDFYEKLIRLKESHKSSSPSSNNDDGDSDSYFDKLNEEHSMVLCQAIIKAADISNPTLQDMDAVLDWAMRISIEFKNQVEMEKEKGLKFLPFMDNNDEYEVAKGQIGFYKALVLPYFDVLGEVLPKTKILHNRATHNLKYYIEYIAWVDDIVEKTKKKNEDDDKTEEEIPIATE